MALGFPLRGIEGRVFQNTSNESVTSFVRILLHPEGKDKVISDPAWEQRNERDGFWGFEIHPLFHRALEHSSKLHMLPQQPLVLDVGANIGFHSLFFAARGCETHAFEPYPANYNLLRCSAAGNKKEVRENLHVYKLAVDAVTEWDSNSCITEFAPQNMVRPHLYSLLSFSFFFFFNFSVSLCIPVL